MPKTTKRRSGFLVMQIGCIECGVDTYPIQICDTIEEARIVEEAHPAPGEPDLGDFYVLIIDLGNLANDIPIQRG